METSLKTRIKTYFENHPNRFINGCEIERLASECGKKGSNASRRLRELCVAGFLERRINGKSVEYKLSDKVSETSVNNLSTSKYLPKQNNLWYNNGI